MTADCQRVERRDPLSWSSTVVVAPARALTTGDDSAPVTIDGLSQLMSRFRPANQRRTGASRGNVSTRKVR